MTDEIDPPPSCGCIEIAEHLADQRAEDDDDE